uniref:Uncharacterized protein n=1 Tax=Glycine max TaxID=3847 RepID=C6T653_SOYBN|nr:unknown [Glycine max]
MVIPKMMWGEIASYNHSVKQLWDKPHQQKAIFPLHSQSSTSSYQTHSTPMIIDLTYNAPNPGGNMTPKILKSSLGEFRGIK